MIEWIIELWMKQGTETWQGQEGHFNGGRVPMKPRLEGRRKEWSDFARNVQHIFFIGCVSHHQGFNQDTSLTLSLKNSFWTHESTNRLMLLINYCAQGHIGKWSGILDLLGSVLYGSLPIDKPGVSRARIPSGFFKHLLLLGALQPWILFHSSVPCPPEPAPRTARVTCSFSIWHACHAAECDFICFSFVWSRRQAAHLPPSPGCWEAVIGSGPGWKRNVPQVADLPEKFWLVWAHLTPFLMAGVLRFSA